MVYFKSVINKNSPHILCALFYFVIFENENSTRYFVFVSHLYFLFSFSFGFNMLFLLHKQQKKCMHNIHFWNNDTRIYIYFICSIFWFCIWIINFQFLCIIIIFLPYTHSCTNTHQHTHINYKKCFTFYLFDYYFSVLSENVWHILIYLFIISLCGRLLSVWQIN